MRSLTKKKTKVWLITLGSVLLTTVLVLSGVGIYIKANSKPKGQPAIVNPLDFSVDAWDGKTVNGLEFNENYAGRGLKTKTIDSASSFVYFVNEVNAGETFDGYTVYLNKSIDLSGYKINSIGSKENPFMGTFDGGYYTIMNATVNGDGLFGCTTNAEIKNVGLYNSTIKSDSEVVGGLIGTAINTNISNSFIRLKEISSKNNVGGLVGEFISNNGEHKIENSFVDTTINANNVGGLVYSLSTNNSSENSVRIENSYYTNGDKAVAVVDNADFLTEEKVIRPTSKNSFVTWDYESDYEKGKTWCDYSYLENSKKLDFNYPILSSFNKVYLTGSHYESVVVSNGEVKDISTLSDAFDEADKSSETKVNLLVEKIFMEARAEVENNVTVKVNAVKDTTIVRGEHNDDSMFVSTGSSKIVLGYDGSDDNISAMSSGSENENIATLTLDGNREEVEKNNQKSGALVVANGTEVEIHENVVLKNNVNNNVGYGGAVLVYGSPSMPIIAGDIENCFAEYGGGGICAVGTAPDTVGNINGCSSNGDGGGIALIEEFDQSSAVKAMSRLYGDAKNVVPTAVTNVTGKPTEYSGTSYSSNNAGGNGGAFSIGSSYGARFSASTITFSNCYAKNGGVIYAQGSIIFWDPTTVNFKNNYATANGGAIWSSCYQAVFNSVVYYGINNGNGSYDGGKFVFDVNHAGYNLDYDSTGSVGYGGAIYLSGQATLANYNTMEFKRGLADYGGAIYMASGSNILNSFTGFSPKMTFNNNMGEIYGGAIYGVGSVQLAGTNEFTDNETWGFGGAIYSGASASVSGTSTFTSNYAGYGESDNYDLGSRGGAIYAATSVGVSGTSTFKSNYAYGQGGAIWSDAVTVTGSSAGKILFQNNNAYSYGGKYDTCGGAIYSEGDLKISNTTFKYNRGYNKGTTYALKGGAIYNHSGSSTTLNKIEIGANTVFEHNFLYDRAAMGGADTQNSMGGAIYAYAATMTVNGAGIVFDGNGYDDTSAEPQYPHSGGGIYFGYGTLSITGTSSSKVQFNGNQTLTRGGAIWANNPVTIQYATFDSNKAGRYTGQVAFGGAIYMNNSTSLTIKGGTTFSGNSAVTDSNQQAGGGAILMNTSSTLTVSGTNTFSGNYADSGSNTGFGGAIYFNTSAKATLGGTNTFSNNYTTSDSNDAFGGAFYFNNSTTLTMSGTNTFNGNHAVSAGTKGHGGAIFFNTGTTATLSGTMNFTGNYGLGVTYSFGGAIYVHATQKSFSMTGTQTFDGNYVQVTTGSAHGGAIYAAGSAWTLNIGGSSNTSRAIFRNNYAKATSTTAGTAYAGAIGFNNSYTGDATTGIGLSVTNATFTNNYISAFGATQGGAIRNNGSNLYIGDNVTFAGNSTTTNSSSWTNGGAAYNGGAKTTTIGNNVVFENNTCSNTVDSLMSLGGGLCVETAGSKLKIANVSGVKFTGNTSAYGGAIFLRNAGEIGGSGDATSIVFENNTSTYVGGAISAAGELEIFCATFKTNKVSASMANTWVGGGAIRMTGSVTLKIGANTIFDGNSVENKSTALYAFAGAILCETPTTLAVSGSNIVFQNNKASYGGAVMVFGAATFTGTSASKISFTGNEAVYGGAIRMQENNTGSISYATFNSNKATSETEWIWVAGGGIYLGSSRTLSLGVGVSFSNNTAKNEVSAGYGHGGAIYIESNSCAVNLASNTYSFTSNSADGTGGAIASHGTINSSDSVLTFTSNSARLGGAIYLESTGSFNVTRSSTSTSVDLTFNSNRATMGDGGAIYFEEGYTFAANTKNLFVGNTAIGNGGAIYAGQYSVSVETGATMSFSSNGASGNGGAIFASSYYSLNKDVFDGNYVAGNGGAIFMDGACQDLNLKNMTFEENVAGNYGGAIYSGEMSGYIHLDGSTFTSNEALAGGAIYTIDGYIYTGNATFTSNTAYDFGGAIATEQMGGVSVGTSTFSSNQAQGDCGGAINAPSVTITGVATFSGNTASVDGGAILANSINITANATFEDNTASGGAGGAIYCGNGSISISCTIITFNGNEAGGEGGAISCYNTNLTITANYVNLNENTAGYSGGAISGYNSDITITANVGYLSNDNTAGTEGGAIYCDGGSLIITARSRIEFQRNSAGSDGGAIYISGQTLSLYAGQSGSSSGEIRIIGNTSEGNGGAIYAHVPDGESSFTGYTLIESNEADGDGGAIYYDSSEANLYFNGGYDVEPAYINQNSARNGGAIYLCDGSISYRSVDEFLFENNTATQNGGAIYSDLDFTPYVNFAFTGNSAQNGGAIFVSGSFDTTAYVGIVGNSASETGAGIYATDGVALNEAYFDNNIATGTLPAQIYAGGITLNQDITIITANNSVADFCLGRYGHITFQTDPTNTYTVYKENITYYNGNSGSGSYIFSGYVTFDASVAGAETPVSVLNMPDSCVLNYNDVESSYGIIILTFDKPTLTSSKFQYDGTEKDVTNSLTMTLPSCVPAGSTLADFITISGNKATDVGSKTMRVTIGSYYRWNTEPTSGTVTKVWSIGYSELRLYDYEGTETQKVYPKYGTKEVYTYAGNAPFYVPKITSITIPTREGYTFLGWYDQISGGNKVLNADATIVAGKANYTNADGNWIVYTSTYEALYERWEAIPPEPWPEPSDGSPIIYKSIGDDVITNAKITGGSEYFTYSILTNEGDVFAISQNADHSQGMSLKLLMTSKVTKADTYSIKLRATDDNTGLYVDSPEYSYSVVYPKLNMKSDASTVKQTIYPKHGTTSVYADCFGVSTSSIQIPTREGYTFLGWYDATTGGKQVVNADGTLLASVSGWTSSGSWSLIRDNVDLYERWSANSIKVTFDANGSTVSTTERNVAFDDAYGSLPTPANKEGYTFAGWEGKNLIDLQNASGSTISVITTTQNSITAKMASSASNGTPGSGNWSSGWLQFGPFALKPDTDYTFSYDVTFLTNPVNGSLPVTHKWLSEQLYNQSARSEITISELNKAYRITKTFKTPTRLTDKVFITISLNSATVKLENVQLEVGNTATAYEPHLIPGTLLQNKNITFMSVATSDYQFLTLYDNVTAGKTYHVNIGDVKDFEGTATEFSVRFYNKTTGKDVLTQKDFSVGKNTSFTVTIPKTGVSDDTDIVVYNGKSGSCTGHRMQYSDVRVYEVTNKLEDTSSVAIPCDHTLIAKWNPNIYTVTYNGNGADSQNKTVDYKEFGSEYGYTRNIYPVVQSYNFSALNPTISNDIFTVNTKNSGTSTLYLNFWTKPISNLKVGMTYTYVIEVLTWTGDSLVFQTGNTSTSAGNTSQLSVNYNTQVSKPGVYIVNKTYTGDATAAYLSRDFITLPAGKTAAGTFRIALFEGNIKAEEYSYVSPGSMLGYNLPTATRTGYNLVGWYSKNMLKLKDLTGTTTGLNHSISDQVYTKTSTMTVETTWLIQKTIFAELFGTMSLVPGTYTWKYHHVSGLEAKNPYIELTKASGETIKWYSGTSVTLTEDCTLTSFRHDTLKFDGAGKTQQFKIQLEQGSSVTAYEKSLGKVEADTLVSTAGNHTLYALWSRIEYTIEFLNQNSLESVTLQYGEEYTLTTANNFYTITYNDGYGNTYVDSYASAYIFDSWTANFTGGTYEILYEGEVYESGSIVSGKVFSGLAYGDTIVVKNLTTTDGATVTFTASYIIEYYSPYAPFERTGEHIAYWYWYDEDENYYDNSNSWYLYPDQDMELFAHWEYNKYYVSFKGNGSTSGSMSSKTYTYYTTYTLPANTFVKSYTLTYNYNYDDVANSTATVAHKFDSWNTAANGSGTRYTDKASVKNLTAKEYATVNLYAQWTAGSVTLPTPTRTGYTFKGWYDQAEGGNLVAAGGATHSISENTTLYAQWAEGEVSYKVKYWLENIDITETLTTSNSTLKASETLTGKTGATTQAVAHDYVGFTAQSFSQKTIAADSSTVIDIFYTRKQYTLTLSAGTGVKSVAGSGTYDYEKEVNISVTELQAGYDWDKWTITTGSAPLEFTETTQNQTIKIGGNVTLTATGKAKELIVTFDANGGSIAGNKTSTVSYGGTYETLPEPSRPGYSFAGWYGANLIPYPYSATSSSEYKVNNDGSIDVNLTTGENQYKGFIFHKNGTIPAGKYKYTNGGFADVQLVFLYKDANNANAWITVTDGNSLTFATDFNYVQFYVQVNPNKTVNGTIYPMFIGDIKPAETYEQFVGFGEIELTSTVTATTNHVLHAKWIANNYTVSFDGKNYIEYPLSFINTNVSTSKQYVTYEGNEQILNVTFESTNGTNTGPFGYIENLTIGETYYWTIDLKTTNAHNVNLGVENRDWRTNQSLTTVWKTFSGKFTATKERHALCVYTNFTVGEILSIKNFSVQHIDSVSFEQALGNRTVTYAAQYGTLPTPTRTGYKFDGWFTSSGTKVTADTVVSTLSNHTLTASWTEIDFDIDGDGDGSGGGSKDIIIAPGDTEILVATIKAEGGSGSFTYEIINANISNFYLNTTGTTSVSTSESVNLYLTVPGVGDWTCQVKITDDHNKLTKTSKVYTVKIKYPTLILKDDNSTTQQTVYPRHKTTTLYTGPQSSSTTSLYTPTSISGHTFLGWYTALNGGKKVINANKTLVANVSGWTTSDSKWALTSSPKTLYERWELNTYTLTFEGNGHGYYMSGNSEYTWYNQSFLWETSFSLTPNKFEGRIYPFIFNPIGCGYDFVGYTDPVIFKNWNTKADGTGTSYADGATITLYGDLTLYAQWESIYKTLEHPNSIAQNNSTFAGFIEQYQTGYTFIGWYTGWNPEDRGTFLGMPGDKWYIPTEYLGIPCEYIYAHWKPNKVNVTYDANGGGFSILTNGNFEHITTNENIGWDNELNGTTIAASGWNSGFGTELPDRDKGYHAHLKTLEDGNTVLRFKTNEDISGVDNLRWLGIPQNVKTNLIAGHTYVLTMDVNRMSGTGYIVAGIYYKKTASDESAAFHSGRYNYKPTVNGEWQTISQTFTMADQYNNDGLLYLYGSYSTIGEYLVDNVVLVDITEGVSQTKLIQETYNSAYTLPIPYKEGSTFLGWTTSSTGGTPLEEGTIVTNANPHTLYAQWSTISPTLTLEFTLDGVVVDASTIGVSADFTIGSDPNKETFTARPSFSRAVDYGTKYQITKVNYISGQYRVTFNANEQTMLASNAKMIIQLETVYYTLKFVYFNGYDAPIHDTKLAFTAPGTTMVVTSSGGATRNDNQIGYGETITIKHPYSTEEITVSVATTNTERRYYIYNGDFGGYHGKPVNASITWTPTSNNTHANFTVIEYLNYSAQSGTGIVANGAKAKYQWTTQEGSYVAGTSSIYQGSQISFRVEDTDLMAGYEFDGWYEDKNGDGTFTINERVSVLKEFIYCEQGNPGGGGLRKDLTLTAVAKAKTITVTFDKVADDATLIGESTSDVAYGQTYGYLPKLTRSGYTFAGWYGKNLADASQFVVINGDGSVKYSYNSVTGVGTIYNSSTSGYGIALYSITLKPNTDYTISADLEWEIAKGSSWGWRIKKATTNTWVGFSNNDTFTFTTDEGGTVSIYFYIGTANANKGNVYISNIQLEEGKTRTSYEAYSSIGEVTAETTVTAIADHTLYAKWTVNTYTITYKENNTFSPMGQDKYQTVTYGQEFTTYSGSIFINPGFTIKGWCENASGSGTLIQTNTNYVYQKAGDMTLYAIWEANTYTVRFEGTNYAENIGHFGINVATATKTTEYVGNEKVEHLTFKSVSGTNTGPYYKIHGLTVGDTYYWSVDVKTTTPHTVNLGIENRDWKTNQSLTTEWQTFSGKFTAVGANSEALCVYQNFTVGETLSIKNMSIQRCADVSFERALGNKTVAYTSQYEALPVPTRTGYNFTGWFTATSGGTEVTSETIVTRAENHTLYAHWTPINYTIVFEPYSCREAADRESITVEAVYDQWVSLEEFTWTFYYTFYLDEGTVYHTEDVTFESYDYYDELGGLICDIYAGGLSNLTTVDGAIVHIYVALYEGMYLPYFEDPTREGYKFAGWYDQAEGGNLVFAPNSGYDGSNAVSVNNKYTSYYAHWTPIEYTIVFDYGDLYSDTVIEPITMKYNEVKKISESFDWTYNLVYYMNNGTDDIFTTQVLGFAHYGWQVDTFGGFYWTDYNKTPIEMNNEVYVEGYYIYNTSFYVKNLTTVDGATVTFTAFPMSEAYHPTYEIPEMTAKQFKHWSDSPNGSTNIYTSETYLPYSFFNRKTIEFYAIWEDAKYNIDVKYEVDGFKLYYDEELDYGDTWETNSRIYSWLFSQGYNYEDYNPDYYPWDPVDYIIAYALECLGLTTNVKAGSTTYQNPLTITGIVHGSEYQITSISRNADKYDVEYDGEKHNITSNTELLIVFTTRTYTVTFKHYNYFDAAVHPTDLVITATSGYFVTNETHDISNSLGQTASISYGEIVYLKAPYATEAIAVTISTSNKDRNYFVYSGSLGEKYNEPLSYSWTPTENKSITTTVFEAFSYDAENGTGIVANSAKSRRHWQNATEAYSTSPRKTYQGAGVDFIATVMVGYTFDGWYDENGNKVTMLSTTATENADGTITYESVYCKKSNPGGGGLREDLKLTAQATINSYSVLIKTANADYGMIWNEGDLMDFESVSCTWEHGALLVIYDQFLGDESSALYLLANPKPSDAQYTYTFDGWYIDNVQVTEGFAVTSSLTIEARFSRTINIYTVSFASSNTDYGTVDLDKFENVPYGTAITVSGNTITVAGFGTVTASPVESDQYTYEFTGWTGVVDSVNGNIEILANFKGNLNQYTVTVVANDEEYGSVNSTKPLPLLLDHGTQITVSGNTITVGNNVATITAVHTTSGAQYTYGFMGWNGVVTGTTNSATITVTKDMNIFAVFTQTLNAYDVEFNIKSVDGKGDVVEGASYGYFGNKDLTTLTYKDIDYGTVITESGYSIKLGENTTVSLSMLEDTAQYTYTFLGWSGVEEFVNGKINITATVQRTTNTYNVQIVSNPAGYGTVSTSNKTVEYGTPISVSGKVLTLGDLDITATETDTSVEDDGYEYSFVNWTGVPQSGIVEGITTVYANFTRKLKNYKLTYYGVDGATFAKANPTTYTYETATFTLENPTMAGYTFAGWVEENVNNEPSKAMQVAYHSMGDKAFTAVWLVDITIEQTGANGNDYKVIVNDLSSDVEHKTSFQLTKGSNYSIYIDTDLIYDYNKNNHQIVRISVNGEEFVTAATPANTHINRIPVFNGTISEGIAIKFEFFDAYMLTVNPISEITGISVETSNVGNNLIIPYSTENAYIVSKGTDVVFSVDSTPVTTAELHTFIGFEYVANNTTHTIGVNGSSAISLTDFEHNANYQNDSDIGTYTYFIDADANVTSITVQAIVSQKVSINTAPITGTITLTSVHGFNKVIDADTSTVILYNGVWTVTRTDLTLNQLKDIFDKYHVEEKNGVITVTVATITTGNVTIVS